MRTDMAHDDLSHGLIVVYHEHSRAFDSGLGAPCRRGGSNDWHFHYIVDPGLCGTRELIPTVDNMGMNDLKR